MSGSLKKDKKAGLHPPTKAINSVALLLQASPHFAFVKPSAKRLIGSAVGHPKRRRLAGTEIGRQVDNGGLVEKDKGLARLKTSCTSCAAKTTKYFSQWS